jgi:NADPH-dependent curcumin reductase CurA
MDQRPATSTSTMRAITQSRYGTSDVLRLADVPVPRPGEGQVLLRVHAAGLDRGTEHLMTASRTPSGLRWVCVAHGTRYWAATSRARWPRPVPA